MSPESLSSLSATAVLGFVLFCVCSRWWSGLALIVPLSIVWYVSVVLVAPWTHVPPAAPADENSERIQVEAPFPSVDEYPGVLHRAHIDPPELSSPAAVKRIEQRAASGLESDPDTIVLDVSGAGRFSMTVKTIGVQNPIPRHRGKMEDWPGDLNRDGRVTVLDYGVLQVLHSHLRETAVEIKMTVRSD